MARYGYGMSVSGSRTPLVAGGATPSGISLTAPTIYLSGLSFQNQDPWTSGNLASPYTLITPGYWEDSNNIGSVVYSGTQWVLRVAALLDGESSAAVVANITALPTSLPPTGWTNTNENLIVSGTLVISTTP